MGILRRNKKTKKTPKQKGIHDSVAGRKFDGIMSELDRNRRDQQQGKNGGQS